MIRIGPDVLKAKIRKERKFFVWSLYFPRLATASARRPQIIPGRKAPAPCLVPKKKRAMTRPIVVMAPKRGTFATRII